MSDRIDDLIISSLSGVGMHLSCRAISRRIEKIHGIRPLRSLRTGLENGIPELSGLRIIRDKPKVKGADAV
jgi:hypothetical protein